MLAWDLGWLGDVNVWHEATRQMAVEGSTAGWNSGWNWANCARYKSRVWSGSSNTVDIPSKTIPWLWQTFYCSRIGNVCSSETWQFLNGPKFGRCIINDQLINGGLVYWVHPVVKKYGNRKSVCKIIWIGVFPYCRGSSSLIICGPLVGCVNTARGGCFGTRCWRL